MPDMSTDVICQVSVLEGVDVGCIVGEIVVEEVGFMVAVGEGVGALVVIGVEFG